LLQRGAGAAQWASCFACFLSLVMLSSALPADLADPSCGHGHALFVTRIGVCALAWNAQAVLAMQLPEASVQATQTRMLGELAQRLTDIDAPAQGLWVQANGAGQLPDHAGQAVAGVQQLLAGQHAHAEDASDEAVWTTTVPAAVLGDLRHHHEAAAAGGLPQLLDIPLDWRGVPDFARQVYVLTRAIAPGQTRTYGDLAQELGGLGLARAVGQALGANPFAPIVPCHRVLAAGREPGGFSGGQGALTKLRMLELEGAAWGGTRSLFE
jgi:methylated-DNA-[protein]-cysteine S-methyltransferase